MTGPAFPRLDDLPIAEQLLVDERADAFSAAIRRDSATKPAPFLADLSGPARVVLLREMLLEQAEWQRGRLDSALLRTYEEAAPDLADLIRVALGDESRLAGWSDPASGPSTDVKGSGGPTRPTATILGYEVADLLGQGGTAVVHRAYHQRLCRWDAVKLPRFAVAEVSPDELSRARARFRREARVQAQIGTAGVPAVFEVGRTADGLPFIAMEAVEGLTYDEDLKGDDAGNRANPTRLREVIGLCRTLASAHALGIYHLDFKPQNIRRTRDKNIRKTQDGQLKILDWGFGRWSADPGSPGVSPSGEGSTETDGRIGGTPGHLAPEQALHQWDRLGDRTDSFAVGVLLLRIVTGAGLFPAGTSLETVMTRTGEGRFDDALARLGPTVPLADLIRRCLQVKTDERPAVAEIADVIHVYLTDREAEAQRLVEEEKARVIRAAERAQRRRILLVAGMILAVVAGLAGWQRWSTVADRAARRSRDEARVLQAISDGQSRLNTALGQRSDDPAQALAALAVLREGLQAAERTEATADAAGPIPRAAFHQFLAESRALLATEQQRAERLAAEKAAAVRDQKLSAGIVDAFDFNEGAIMASLIGDGNPDPFQFDARIIAALRDCGITVTTLANPRALAELAARPAALRDELALALEMWGLELKADDPDRATVLAAVERIDPDPARREIRAVLADNSLLLKKPSPTFVGPLQPNLYRERLVAVARAALEPHSPRPSLVTLGVGIALIDTPDEKLGLDLFRMIAARRPDSAPANWFAASFITHSEPSGYQRAMPYYQALRALRPATGFSMVSTLAREGRGREAEAILNEIEQHRGPSLEVDMYRAIILLNESLLDRDRLDEAVALMARVVEHRPDNAMAHGMYAVLLVKPRRFAEAAEHARESIRLDPRESLGHFVLGTLAMQRKNLDEADAEFRTAIDLKEMPLGCPNAMLALCLSVRGRFDEARKFLERANRLEPNDAVVQSFRATALALMGRDFEAQAICDGVLAGRDEEYAQMARLILASRARNWVVAEAAALAVIRSEPEEPAWYTLLGSALNQLGEVDRMIPVYAHLTEVEPNNLVHWTMGVSARLIMADLAGAEVQARAALKHFPRMAPLHRWLATALVRQRRYDEAIAESKLAISGTLPFTPARREQTEEHANLTRIAELVPRLADVVAGRVEPADGEADLLRFARLAAYEGNLTASSDLFQKAFAAASQPLDRVGHPHLVSGVRQAILASAQPETSNDQRTEQRERALSWLATDLRRFRTRGAPGPLFNPDEVYQQLRLWQVCPGLDSVRDPVRRNELPNDERDRWAAFWDEVELTRQEARSIIASRKPHPRSPASEETPTNPPPPAETTAAPLPGG